jgi:hypothetical protein
MQRFDPNIDHADVLRLLDKHGLCPDRQRGRGKSHRHSDGYPGPLERMSE